MATNTKNFNFKKPDESDFYSIQDQNGNWDLADEELQKLNEPAFEDYTTGTSVPSAATALEALKSKIKLPIWMSNVVAFCKGCCTLAMIVNNCVSSDADKPLAAAQGKALQDQLTKLYSDFQYKELTNDFDLNNALGKYRTDSSIIITSLKNKPSEIRNSGEATIDWYPANERNTYGIQIMRWTYGNTHMIFTRNKIENTWAEWVQYVTKSDLGDLITHRKTTGNTSDSGNITINRPEGYSLIGAYINSVYVRLSIPTVYQKTIIVRCFDENMSPLKNTLVEVISLWIKKDISY